MVRGAEPGVGGKGRAQDLTGRAYGSGSLGVSLGTIETAVAVVLALLP